MKLNRSRPALIAVLAVAMVLVSGIAGVVFATTPMDQDESDTPNGGEIITEFREQISSLETAQFTRSEQFTFNNNNTETSTVHIKADLDSDQKRTETDEFIQVWDGNTITTYNSVENTVSERRDHSTQLLPRIEQLANESMVDYEYLDTDTVDGQDVYELEASSNQTVDTNGSTTIYVSTETYFPLEVESQVQSADSAYSVTTRYENVTLNQGIPASAFELDLPDDVEDRQNDGGPEISRYDTYENAVSNTAITLPPADLTENFNFDRAAIFEDADIDTVSIFYTDGEQTVTVNIEPDTAREFSAPDQFESIDIGDKTGYISVSDEFVSLRVEGDQLYSIHGATDKQTATGIAEALVSE